ncbi:SufD family Fe-S cluster assembly protein, partial [Candidatus Micrarchaeota archaeon]|nr:SufD family Fe-S cluster assembly protein [Candidatus Micrarchaeota archaeon]
HSASVGEIDEEKIFYLMSRGLARKDAKKAMLEGFLNPVLTRVGYESLKADIENRIEQKYEN